MSWEFNGFKIGGGKEMVYRGVVVPPKVLNAIHDAGSNKEEVGRILREWWASRKKKP